MQQIRVQGVVVPEVVLVVLTLPVSINHVVEETSHPEADVGPEDGPGEVEPRVKGSHDFVVWVVREALVGGHVRERLLEGDDSVLHQGKGAKPEDGHAGASVRPPLPVEVHLNVLVEHTVATLDGLSIDTLAEIAHLLGQVLDIIPWLSRIRLVELQEALRRPRD